jgi:hypothetical protein
MKDLLYKIKLFYAKITKKHETYKRYEIKPIQDWSILLTVCFIILCILVVFAFYLFIQIKNDKLFTITETNMLKEVKLNMGLLNKTINEINLREELTNNIKRNGVRSPDPSL